MKQWENWAGNIKCRPQTFKTPGSEEDLVSIVRQCTHDARIIRVAGSGHSFTPLCETDDTLLSLAGLNGVVAADAAACEATIWAGTTISQLGPRLHELGMAFENQGDVDYQAMAGAVSTGTHGTGTRFGSFSSCVTALRLVLASGEILHCSATVEPEVFRAARVSLGTLGVITQVTIRLVPSYRLHERIWAAPFEEAVHQIDGQINGNEHFEFFWLPSDDMMLMKALNSTDAQPFGQDVPPEAPPGTIERYYHPERVDWSYRVYPSERTTPFVEMEFAVPAARGPECFRELRQLLREKHPSVVWPIEYRTQRGDDSYLSSVYQRDSVTLSVHESPDKPYQRYFDDVEAIFRNHDGRPHWGKLHSHRARDLQPLFPMWDRFSAVRDRLDPQQRFLNPYLRGLLLEE